MNILLGCYETLFLFLFYFFQYLYIFYCCLNFKKIEKHKIFFYCCLNLKKDRKKKIKQSTKDTASHSSQPHLFIIAWTAASPSCMMNGAFLKVSRRLVDTVFCFLFDAIDGDSRDQLSVFCWHAARPLVWGNYYILCVCTPAAEGVLMLLLLLFLLLPLGCL